MDVLSWKAEKNLILSLELSLLCLKTIVMHHIDKMYFGLIIPFKFETKDPMI